MYNYSPQTCLIKDIDGKIYNIIDLWQGKKIPVDLTTIQYSYAPKSCLVQNVDGTNVNVIDTILAVANGSGSGTSSLEEVIQARGKYSTLGERLDKDNEKIYETINDKDFIPFEGENVAVEHSKVGFTKDMKVEGMTYQNLLIDRVALANDINVFNHNYNKVSLKQGEGYIEVTSINENNDYTLLGYDVHLTQEPNLFKFNTQYLVMADIEILENQTNASFCVGGFLNNIKNKKINSGRGIVAKVMETGSDFNGNNGWISVGSDSMVSKGTKFRYYGGIALELSSDELSNKSIDELINKYWFGKFEGIKSVGEKENKISILTTGKNLVNFYMFEASSDTKIQINSDHIVLEGNRQYANMSVDLTKLNLIEGKTYYTSMKVENIIGSQVYHDIWINDKSTTKWDFVYKKGDKVKLHIFANRDVFPSKSIIRKIMVSETNEEYVPYQVDKKEILLPFEGGLKGLPSGAKDTTILKEDGLYIRQKIDKKILNSNSNNFFLVDAFSSIDVLGIGLNVASEYGMPSYPNKAFGNENGICNSLKEISCQNASPNYVVFKVPKSKLETQDIAGFKKWLQNNPTTFYYQLPQPIEHKITDLNSINLETFKDITYISSENEIQPNLSFKAPVDVQATISTLRENNAQLSNELEVKTQELQEKDKELANEDDLLTAKDLDMDFRIFELEEQLTPEIAKLSMSHNSPYPMIKRCIEKGLYEKEDMLYKMNRYLHGKRLTQEEYDHIIALMDADEIR